MAHLSAYFSLSGIDDRHDGKELKRELDRLPGVTSVSISGSGRLAVDYDSTGVRKEHILQKLQSLGYQVQDHEG